MPGIRRHFSGPNGTNNFLPDNSDITITRDINDRIIRIDVVGPHGQTYHRIITRNPAGLVTDVDFWVQDVA